MLWEVNADKCHNKILVWVFGAMLVRFLAPINPARLKLLSTSAELMRYHRYGMIAPRNGPGLWSDHWNVMLRPNGTPCVPECCYVCCMLDGGGYRCPVSAPVILQALQYLLFGGLEVVIVIGLCEVMRVMGNMVLKRFTTPISGPNRSA